MRKLIAILAVPLVAACSLTLAPLADGGNCGGNSYQRGSQCTSHIPIVIIIGPSYQYSDNSDRMCYQFSPVAASVTIGGSYSFQNNTSSPITILGADRVPWVTVGPGSTSAALSFPSAGTYNFGVQGCNGVGGTAMYGVLAVTTS
jgi:hypothetical protein